MEKQKFLELLREVKSAAMATVGMDGAPRVRIIDVMLVEDEKLYFCTARGKDFYRELLATEQVAITGMNAACQTVRLHGSVRHLTDRKKWIDRIFEENPVMNEVYPGKARCILEPFCVSEGELEFFDLSSVPVEREYGALGERRISKKGFEIQENCIGCGRCQKECPQKCILPGDTFWIVQEHCLHCGLCFENCPVKAVKRRDEK